MIRTETQMDPHVRAFFASRGYRIKGELAIGECRADLAARKEGSDQIVIIEMAAQVHADRRHLGQIIRWKDHTPAIFLVLLSQDADRWIENPTAQLDAEIAGYMGFGLLVVDAKTGQVIQIPHPPKRKGRITTAPELIQQFDRYEKAGIDPVGGTPGNAGKSPRRIRADQVAKVLEDRATIHGRAAKWKIKTFSPWFESSRAEAIKRELAEDDRFVFITIRGVIHVGLAPEVEAVTASE